MAIVERLIAICLTTLLALPALAAGERIVDLRNDLTVFQGAARLLGPGASGDLISCPDSRVLRTELSFVAMPGVCDDLGARRCDGRLLAQMERCVSGNQALAAPGVSGGYSKSLIRLCFDDLTTPPACSGETQFATGTWNGAGYGTPGAALLQATAILSIDTSEWFEIDGERLRLRPQSLTQHFVLQPPTPVPGGCATSESGCGLVGVSAP